MLIAVFQKKYLTRSSPQIEFALNAAAQKTGVDIETLIERMVRNQFPLETTPVPTIDAENAFAIAQLYAILEEEATDDPEAIKKSEQEVEELMQNLNKNRIQSGERPLFP